MDKSKIGVPSRVIITPGDMSTEAILQSNNNPGKSWTLILGQTSCSVSLSTLKALYQAIGLVLWDDE